MKSLKSATRGSFSRLFIAGTMLLTSLLPLSSGCGFYADAMFYKKPPRRYVIAQKQPCPDWKKIYRYPDMRINGHWHSEHNRDYIVRNEKKYFREPHNPDRCRYWQILRSEGVYE